MPSFDTVCDPDMVQVRNAVDNAAKEIGTRFDFKGTSAAIELKDKEITLLGDADTRYETSLESIALLPPAQESSAESASSTTTTATAIYYNGILHAPNPDGVLRVSMTAQVHIVVDRVQGALTVPASALGAKDDEGRYAVRVLTGEGDAQREETCLVRVGLNNRVHAQVLEGLKEGERVITGEATPAGDAVSVEMGPPPPMGP